MWEIRKEKVYLPNLPDVEIERSFLQEGNGPKLVWQGFGERVADGEEKFRYEDGDLSFSFVASRLDRTSGLIGGRYTVWLGLALQAISNRSLGNAITIDLAREISKDIKNALLAWRYSVRAAQELRYDPSAENVTFVMTQWERWDATLEQNWP
jgi:hypothetical protein